MATVTISGTNKLAERIVSDAQAEANRIMSEAEETVNGFRRDSDKAVAARKAELLSQKQSAIDSLISGYRTRASLDGKKDVNLEALKKAGLVRKSEITLKLLAKGELKAKVSLHVDFASDAAKAVVEKSGGSVTVAPVVEKTVKAKKAQ